MPSPATYARIFRAPARADETRTVVQCAGLFWSITGEFTTPALGRTPAFTATDVRLVNDDGSESADMLDMLASAFVAQLQAQAVESLTEGRRYAA